MRKYKVVQVPDPETGELIHTNKLSPTKYANHWLEFAKPISIFSGMRIVGINPFIHLRDESGYDRTFDPRFVAKLNKLLKQYQALEEELRLLKEKS